MPGRAETIVIQSHRWPLPFDWLQPCIESVKAWSESRGYAYRFEDDVLFERLDADVREKTLKQPVIAADLARLAALQAALEEGYGCVVWMDADMLVVDPQRLELAADRYALGREVWIQEHAGRLRAYVKVHNAFLQFRRDNPFLAFYRHAAERIVRAHQGPMVPQLVGPKLLTALHNLVGCPVVEEAGMLSPAVLGDLLEGGGPALEMFRARSQRPPAAVNVCGSMIDGQLSAGRLREVAARLRALDRPMPVNR